MIDIIVVNWNSGKQLFDLIQSVAEHHSNLVNSIIVVDNASSDDSIDVLNSNLYKYHKFKFVIIRNLENVGFGAACNQGAKECSSEYLLFLNPDVIVYDNTFKIVSNYMESWINAEIGICGIQLIDELGNVSRTCARFPTPLSFFYASLGLNRLLSSVFKSMHMHDWDHQKTEYVDHVIGAFYWVRASLFKKLKGFDERFFVYLEDLDFSYRARLEGYRSIYLTEAQSFHLGGGTSNKVKATRLFYSLRSRLVYSRIHFNVFGFLLVYLTTLIVEPCFRIINALIKRSNQQVFETLQGYKMLHLWSIRWFFEKK